MTIIFEIPDTQPAGVVGSVHTNAPRFEHRILSSGEHCVTSPNVKGLCAVADTEAEARRGAADLLAQFQRFGLPIRPRAERQKPEAV